MIPSQPVNKTYFTKKMEIWIFKDYQGHKQRGIKGSIGSEDEASASNRNKRQRGRDDMYPGGSHNILTTEDRSSEGSMIDHVKDMGKMTRTRTSIVINKMGKLKQQDEYDQRVKRRMTRRSKARESEMAKKRSELIDGQHNDRKKIKTQKSSQLLMKPISFRGKD